MKQSAIHLEISPIKEEGFHVFLSLQVNGHPLRMLLDTGASRTIFDLTNIKQILMADEFEENEDKAVGLGSNAVDNYVVTINNISIGTLDIQNYQVGALDLTHVNESYTKMGLLPIDGVLGSDLLIHFKAVIDMGKAELCLTEA